MLRRFGWAKCVTGKQRKQSWFQIFCWKTELKEMPSRGLEHHSLFRSREFLAAMFRFKMCYESVVLYDFVDQRLAERRPCQSRRGDGPLLVPDCAARGSVARGLERRS